MATKATSKTTERDEEVIARSGAPKPVRTAITVAREQGVLASDDDLEAVAFLVKYKNLPWLILLGIPFAIVGMFVFAAVAWVIQRTCYVFVTSRHVIFTQWVNGRNVGGVMRLERPVQLALSKPPKKNHSSANPVQIPAPQGPKVAKFLGRETVYAQAGILADQAFQIARTPAGMLPPAGPPAGWYPNPQGPGRRYWDGARWTETDQESQSEGPGITVGAERGQTERGQT